MIIIFQFFRSCVYVNFLIHLVEKMNIVDYFRFL